MKINCFRLFVFLFCFFFITNQVSAYWVWSPSEGKFISPESAADSKRSAEELYQSALKLKQQKGKEGEVVRELQRIVRTFPQSAFASEAQFLIAAVFEEREKPLRAVAEYKKLVKEFPRSERIDAAIERLFQIGNYFLTGEKQKVMGVAIIPVYSRAADIFKFIVEQAPYGAYGDQAQLRLGIVYRKMGNFNEAVNAFENLIANHPTSPLVDEAQYQLAETSYELSQNASRDQVAVNQASTYLKQFIQQYGTTSLAERARILKQQLDEQDAEKNYRIGLYYEKQGATESALIYYEDVADRYPQTVYGKKAAQRLANLEYPLHAIAKGQAAIEQRIAEIRSFLEALDQQETAKGKKKTQETADVREQLKSELSSLLLSQKQFKQDARQNFVSRKKAFLERQKNLREKTKTFRSRKKESQKSPSPELEEILQKWQFSLEEEGRELAEERKTLSQLRLGMKGEKKTFDWLPFVGGEEKPSKKLVKYDQKKWKKLAKERAEIKSTRERYQSKLQNISIELAKIDRQEFAIAKNLPSFRDIFPIELKNEESSVSGEKTSYLESKRSFGIAKNEFEQKYGTRFTRELGIQGSAEKTAVINRLLASGKSLEQILGELQNEKVVLSTAWLAEKEKLDTMSKAFGESKAQEVKSSVSGDVDPVKEGRLLKKRMKYVEREIRSRIDQIQDWQRENAKRMKRLEGLLNSKDEFSKMSGTAKTILNPAKGTYKLTKAFLFGLENKDQKIMQKAGDEIKQNEVTLQSDERVKQIRELQEEIELQGVLIQGRTLEIKDLQDRLKELQDQAETIPNFSYQSLLIERIPSDLAHSVSKAKEMASSGNQNEAFLNRVKQQSELIVRLEKKINLLTDQIEMVGSALAERSEKKSKAKVSSSIPGGAETLPQESSQEQAQAESKLVQLKAEFNVRQSNYERAETEYQEHIFHWFRQSGRQKISSGLPKEMKKLMETRAELAREETHIRAALIQVLKREQNIVQSQKDFMEQKLSELEKRLEKLEKPSESSYQALVTEINDTRQVRDSLIREFSSLQNLAKQ